MHAAMMAPAPIRLPSHPSRHACMGGCPSATAAWAAAHALRLRVLRCSMRRGRCRRFPSSKAALRHAAPPSHAAFTPPLRLGRVPQDWLASPSSWQGPRHSLLSSSERAAEMRAGARLSERGPCHMVWACPCGVGQYDGCPPTAAVKDRDRKRLAIAQDRGAFVTLGFVLRRHWH